MATDIYSDRSSIHDRRYQRRRADAPAATYRDAAGKAFLWIAWVIAFAFWAFSMSTFFGILRAIAAGGPGTIMAGRADYPLLALIGGGVVLAVAIAWGMARWAVRGRRRDAAADASTAAPQRQMNSRPQEAGHAGGRDGYRPA